MADEYLTFTIADERFGIGIDRVRSILEYQPVTVMPNAAKCIRGVINLRGAVVPVVDLAVKFGMKTSDVTKWTCLVVVDAHLGDETTPLALVADVIEDVLRFAPDDIAAPPAFGTRVRLDFLRGLGRLDKKFALLLELDRVLSIEELTDAAQLASNAGQLEPAATAGDTA